MSIIQNKLDQFIFFSISYLLVLLYFLWYFVNIFHIYYRSLWLAIIPLSLAISHVLAKQYSFGPTENNKKTTSVAYMVFFLLLAGALLYYLEPALRYPTATLGIPNKDLHDALAVYIGSHGHPPSQAADPASTKFVINSQSGLYLGYPNVLHSFAALLIRLGTHPFHATYLATVIVLLGTSCALFLLLKFLTKDVLSAAALAGLFMLSSFRIPFSVAASVPMLFSYGLILPGLLAVLVSIYHHKDLFSYILPVIAVSLLAASYSGTIAIFVGIFFIYALFLLHQGKKEELNRLGKIALFSLPLLAITLFYQEPIYWRNTFPTAADFDPYELSQRLMPLDKPLYMGVLIAGLASFIWSIKKNQLSEKRRPLHAALMVLSCLLLLFIPYDLIFHFLNGTGKQALLRVNPNGFFGGLNHQKISRLALLQPFIFIFFLGEAFGKLKHKGLRTGLLIGFLLTNFVVRSDLSFYNPLQKELRRSFYNENDKNKTYTLLSDLRLLVNKKIWTDEIHSALAYLDRLPKDNLKVFLLDGRGWTEETIANWGSLLLKRKIYRLGDISFPTSTKPLIINYLQREQYNYGLFIQPEPVMLEQINSRKQWRLSYHEKDVYLYQINPIILEPISLKD